MRMRVDATTPVTEDSSIRRIDLVAVGRDRTPSFVPGSHVVVRCGADRFNAYSLIGSPHRPHLLSIAVLRLGDGSRWLHERTVGDEIEIGSPRSTFAPALTARRLLLVAGGIGVTPILSLARSASVPVEVHYVHRPGRGAFAADLVDAACVSRISESRETFTDGLAAALIRQPLGTHLYVCGPIPMIAATLAAARSCGWPESRLHTEAFAVSERPSRPFEVGLARTGRTLAVAAHESLLDVLDAAAVPVDRQCRHGVCGRCRTRVLAGAVDHRDLVLTEDEHARSEEMMVCVSRADGAAVVIDL